LLTPSLLSIACIARRWIRFKVFTSIIVTGSEYVIDRVYVLRWKMNVSISLRQEVDSRTAYWFALSSRNAASFR
jgi:hypothetical protein